MSGDLEAAGITLAIAGAKGEVRALLERTGLTERIGRGRMFPTVAAAVDALSLGSAER